MVIDEYNFFGMHLLWWLLLIGILYLIFATPYNIPGQKNTKDSPLDILKRRFDGGYFTEEEYIEKKKILEADHAILLC